MYCIPSTNLEKKSQTTFLMILNGILIIRAAKCGLEGSGNGIPELIHSNRSSLGQRILLPDLF